MKKKIGISFTSTNYHYYWDWFTKEDLGDDLELLELSFEKNNVEDFSKCDGFLLTGGVDIDTEFYGGAPGYNNRPDSFQTERDRFEEKIFRYSQEHQIPVLGICRGLQAVNVFQGGKLIEDLDQGNDLHSKENNIDKIHSVELEEGSLLNEIAGLKKGEVNSAHHQAAHASLLGKNLIVNARSENDSIIEGLEFDDKTGKAFMLCVQWHPERMKDKEKNPLSVKIKKRFLEEVKKSKERTNEDH